MFHLTAKQMEEEPIDQIMINLFIQNELNKQQAREEKWQTRT